MRTNIRGNRVMSQTSYTGSSSSFFYSQHVSSSFSHLPSQFTSSLSPFCSCLCQSLLLFVIALLDSSPFLSSLLFSSPHFTSSLFSSSLLFSPLTLFLATPFLSSPLFTSLISTPHFILFFPHNITHFFTCIIGP